VKREKSGDGGEGCRERKSVEENEWKMKKKKGKVKKNKKKKGAQRTRRPAVV